jgi:PilZ domain
MDVHITPVNNPTRRWPRHRLDVPLRVIIHTPDKTVIRDGRGCELGEGGMSFAAGVELKKGDQVEIEFTPAYSGRPIRVRAVARNGNGYSYGAEFVASSDQERQEIISLRENLQKLSSAYSPSYFHFSSQITQASERRHDGLPRSPTEHAAALLNVSSGHTLECGPLPAGNPHPVGNSRRGGQKPQLRSTRKKLGTISRVPTETR